MLLAKHSTFVQTMGVTKKKALFVVFVVGLVLLLSFLNLLLPVRVLSFFPEKQIESTKSSLTIRFSKAVDLNSISLVLVPNVPGSLTLKDSTTAVFVPYRPFQLSWLYRATVTYQGKQLSSVVFEGPRAFSDQDSVQKSVDFVKNNFPLAPVLPFDAGNYQLRYISPLTLRVIYHGAQPEESVLQQWVRDQSARLGIGYQAHSFEFKEEGGQ